jgi:hypothetical protein
VLCRRVLCLTTQRIMTAGYRPGLAAAKENVCDIMERWDLLIAAGLRVLN